MFLTERRQHLSRYMVSIKPGVLESFDGVLRCEGLSKADIWFDRGFPVFEMQGRAPHQAPLAKWIHIYAARAHRVALGARNRLLLVSPDRGPLQPGCMACRPCICPVTLGRFADFQAGPNVKIILRPYYWAFRLCGEVLLGLEAS